MEVRYQGSQGPGGGATPAPETQLTWPPCDGEASQSAPIWCSQGGVVKLELSARAVPVCPVTDVPSPARRTLVLPEAAVPTPRAGRVPIAGTVLTPTPARTPVPVPTAGTVLAPVPARTPGPVLMPAPALMPDSQPPGAPCPVPATARTPVPPDLPGDSDAVYRRFARQGDAFDYTDAANAVFAAAAMAHETARVAGDARQAARAGAEGRAGGACEAGESGSPTQSVAAVRSTPTAPAEAVKVFCVEGLYLSREGDICTFREFLAASYPALWAWYRATPIADRHVYEMLRDGRPCHLYFDLEFVPAANSRLASPAARDALVDALLDLVDAEAVARWGEALDRSCVVESDSSTRAKWSRHIVARLPGGRAFVDVGAAGRFVMAVLARDEAGVLRVRKGGRGGEGGECR